MFFKYWPVRPTIVWVSIAASFVPIVIIYFLFLDFDADSIKIAGIFWLIVWLYVYRRWSRMVEEKYPKLFASTIDSIEYYQDDSGHEAVEWNVCAGDVRFVDLSMNLKTFHLTGVVHAEVVALGVIKISASVSYDLGEAELGELIRRFINSEGAQQIISEKAEEALKETITNALVLNDQKISLKKELVEAGGYFSDNLNKEFMLALNKKFREMPVRIEETTIDISDN